MKMDELLIFMMLDKLLIFMMLDKLKETHRNVAVQKNAYAVQKN